MLLIMETICLCLVFWGICYAGTGTDEKNIKSFSSYPEEVQQYILRNPQLSGKVKKSSPAGVFVSNVVLFTVILFLLGIPLRTGNFWDNFLKLLIMGQVLNAFDFFIMDSLWFRRTRRTRFSGTEDRDDMYRSLKNHRAAFFRGIPAFLIVAVIGGLLLCLF